LFRKREWNKARVLYADLAGKHGAIFLERIAELEAAPPPHDWSGLTVLRNK
jgi:hypothetical protein